ncbi:MAG: F0F1 ATP synthase subunit B [Armatimonadota bacterium]|nr:F0F1 ATP synthase subunit B [bacterium]
MQIIPEPKVLIVQALGFLLVLGVFKLFLFQPIMGILEARRREIASEYDSAEANRANAEELKAEYERHLAQIAEETRAKIAEAVKDGQTMREEILADSRSQAEKILTRAQEEIGREREKAIVELKTTVANLTVDAAGKLIGETMNDDKHRRLINGFIDDLGEVKN